MTYRELLGRLSGGPDDGIRVRPNGSAYLTDAALLELYDKMLNHCRTTAMDELFFTHGWRPINTAPQDGTPVRLKAGDHQHVGSFAVHEDGGVPEWRMHSKDIGWCRDNPPTHWMALRP